MSDWIKWNGGVCPVSGDTKVFVRLRDGVEHTYGTSAHVYMWNHGCMPSDIVAYKVAGPEQNKMPIDMEMTPEEEEAFNEMFETQQKTLEKSALDVQVGGGHYKGKGIQPVQYIHANQLGFLEGCIVKRITRWRDKGGKQDLLKIKHEVDLLIQLEGL